MTLKIFNCSCKCVDETYCTKYGQEIVSSLEMCISCIEILKQIDILECQIKNLKQILKQNCM